MTGLAVTADIPSSTDLFGKSVTDLQENAVVRGNKVFGTVKYIADYSAAGYGDGEDSGNYLVLHCAVPGEDDVTITSELVGGVHGPVTLDDDGIVITRITNKNTQTIKVTASKDGYESVTKTFRLNGLNLVPAPAGT